MHAKSSATQNGMRKTEEAAALVAPAMRSHLTSKVSTNLLFADSKLRSFCYDLVEEIEREQVDSYPTEITALIFKAR